MVLLDDFYNILSLEKDGQQINAVVMIDKNHAIFEGHFPGQPVVPGVCTMQMVNELTSKALSLDLRIAEGHNIKFISMVIPQQHDSLSFSIKYEQGEDQFVKINSFVRVGEHICFKFKGRLVSMK